MCKKRGKKYNPRKVGLKTCAKSLLKNKAFVYYNGVQAIIDVNNATMPKFSENSLELDAVRNVKFPWSMQFSIFTRTPKGEIAAVYDEGFKMPPCHAHNIDQVLTQHLGMRARDYHCQMFDEYSGKGLEIAGVGWMATVDGSTLTTEQQNRCYSELGAFND